MLVDEVQQDGSIDKNEGELLKNAIEFSEQQAQDILIHRVDLAALPVTAEPGGDRRAVHRDQIFPPARLSGFHRPHPRHHPPARTFYVGCGVTGQADRARCFHRPSLHWRMSRSACCLKRCRRARRTSPSWSTNMAAPAASSRWRTSSRSWWARSGTSTTQEEILHPRDRRSTLTLWTQEWTSTILPSIFHLKTDSEMVSVSGWVMERCGGVPESGDRFTYDDLDVLVVKVDHQRIEELRVTQRPHAGEKVETALIGEMAHE